MSCCIDGLYCAETVLKEIADRNGIDSPLIPRIATGLCSGMARTCGPCGALTGGILALNIIHGRDNEAQPVERNYAVVQELIERFRAEHGSIHCHKLLGCDLGTPEGQQIYNSQNLNQKCAQFSDKTIQLVEEVLLTA